MTAQPARERRTAVDELADALRQRILDGELVPGHPLREEALSDEYGVGRHTVRAALRQLGGVRLVDIQPFSGARVALLGADEIRALMQLRSALEGEAVRLLVRRYGAAPRAAAAAAAPMAECGAVQALDAAAGDDRDSGGLPRSIHSANDALRRTCLDTPDDRPAIERAHAALHHAIVAAADSPRITEAHAELEAESLLFLSQLRGVLDAPEMIRQHDALVATLLTRGPAAIHDHLAQAAAHPPRV